MGTEAKLEWMEGENGDKKDSNGIKKFLERQRRNRSMFAEKQVFKENLRILFSLFNRKNLNSLKTDEDSLKRQNFGFKTRKK